MKKILIVLAVIMILILSNKSYEEIIIPKESIRVRVIANSNSQKDQLLKKQVKKSVSKTTNQVLKNVTNKKEADKLIKENIPLIDKEIKNTLSLTDEKNYKISYGKNYFPEKKFKGVTYEEGYYDSLVITLGDGKGENWWCVLFPPLCLMEATEEETTEVEYKSFIKEIIDKYF